MRIQIRSRFLEEFLERLVDTLEPAATVKAVLPAPPPQTRVREPTSPAKAKPEPTASPRKPRPWSAPAKEEPKATPPLASVVHPEAPAVLRGVKIRRRGRVRELRRVHEGQDD